MKEKKKTGGRKYPTERVLWLEITPQDGTRKCLHTVCLSDSSFYALGISIFILCISLSYCTRREQMQINVLNPVKVCKFTCSTYCHYIIH